MSESTVGGSTRLSVGDLNLEIRPAVEGDVPLLLDFIRAMASFEKLEASVTAADLRASLFGDRPAAEALLLVADGTPAGYVTYFYSFSSMMGRRALWLEDLFVDPAYRGRGIGHAVMCHLARVAVDNGCGRFEWIVLDWNTRAVDFYRRLGAHVSPDWRICQVTGEALGKLAAGE